MLDDLLQKILSVGSPNKAGALLAELELGMFEEDFTEQQLIDRFFELVTTQESMLCGAKGLWALLKYVDESLWDQMSDEQKVSLLSFCKRFFGHFAEWVTAMVVCDLFSRRMKPSDAFKIYQELLARADSMTLEQSALIPYGLWRVVEQAAPGDRSLANDLASKVAPILERLSQSTNDAMKKEARLSIHRIASL